MKKLPIVLSIATGFMGGIALLIGCNGGSNDANAGNGSVWQSFSNNIYFDSGNVGIGTNNPDHRLHVNGNVKVEGSISPYIQLYEQNGDNQLKLKSVDGDLVFDFGSVEKIRIEKTTGNLGIGTDNPIAKLDIEGDIRFNGQKACSAVLSGNWRDTIIVPSSWSASTCAKFAQAEAAVTMSYNLYCIFEDGFSVGSVNGGIPSPNCGW